MVFLAGAVVFLVPLALTPHLLLYYDITPKIALIFLAAAAGLVALSFEWDSWAAFARVRTGRWFLSAACCSLLIGIISALRSAESSLSWYGSNWRRMGALTEAAVIFAGLWIAQYAIRSQRNLVILLRAICAAGLLASLYGVAQYLGWDPFLPRGDYEVGEGVFQIVRPPGTLGHSDYFAAFLLWPVFAGLALSLVERSAAWRTLAVAASAGASVTIVLSGSRGALLGLLAGAAVRILLKRPLSRNIAIGSAIALAFFAAFYISPAGQRLRARVHWIGEDRIGGARLLLWRDSLNMAAQKPLTGFGPDAFSAEFPKFESVALARAFPDFYHESPHNLSLDVLTSQGVFGFLALIVVIGAAVAGGLWQRTNPLVLAFLPGLAAAVIADQFAVLIAPTAFYFYIGAAALAGSGASHSTQRIASRWRVAVLPLGFACAAFLALTAYRVSRQDAMLATVDRHLDARDFAGAAQEYRRALSVPGDGVSADLYFSRKWSQLAMSSTAAMSKIYYSQVAAGAATRATRQPEQLHNAWYNLAVLAAARNDSAGTEYALRAALAAAPNWYKPHWTLARLLAAEGRREEAEREAKYALELNAGKDSEVASTLAQVLRSPAPRP